LCISYSPEKEKEFNQNFKKLKQHADNENQNLDQLDSEVYTFSDASFGVCYKSLRSISGVAIFLRGTIVAWKSSRQSLFTGSTSESEYVALSDAIQLEQGCHALSRFLLGNSEMLDGNPVGPLWCDNRSAVLTARQGVSNVDAIAKKSRHIALRFSRVLTQSERIWFTPTTMQLSDGLTKSKCREALMNLFNSHRLNQRSSTKFDDDETDDEVELTAYYARMIQ
jgi:hypothetical protein